MRLKANMWIYDIPYNSKWRPWREQKSPVCLASSCDLWRCLKTAIVKVVRDRRTGRACGARKRVIKSSLFIYRASGKLTAKLLMRMRDGRPWPPWGVKWEHWCSGSSLTVSQTPKACPMINIDQVFFPFIICTVFVVPLQNTSSRPRYSSMANHHSSWQNHWNMTSFFHRRAPTFP